MREILFRGKRTDNNEWIYGQFVQSNSNINKGKMYILDGISDFSYGDNGNRIRIGCFIEVIPETVGQYTDLKDKNGTRVFEGDICKGKNFIHEFEEIFEVIFDKENAAFYFYGQKSENDYCYGNCENIEVIGNIHDNPELLNQ